MADRVRKDPLPNRRPDRAWGGPSVGAHCAICNMPVRQGEHEFELDFVRDGAEDGLDTYHVHVRCYWEWTSRKARSAGGVASVPEGHDP
jgi:hypothetical protein